MANDDGNRLQSVRQLLQQRRILVCVGSGGVGKTTSTAALGLLGVSQGMRVLCLTIDPARRLAESLGMAQVDASAQAVEPERIARAGVEVSGTLTIMMLDTAETFNEVVRKYAPNEQVRERILNNRIYQYVANSLAGTQEYMALEKLHEVVNSGQFDLVILDTPPTSHALDFLEAPERLIDAVDGVASRWIMKAFRTTGGSSFEMLSKPAAMALRGLSRFTGKGFLEQIASFLSDIHDLFGGFSERARAMQQVLRGKDVAYVLVAAPHPGAVQEVLLFADRLASMGAPVDLVLLNRVHPVPPSGVVEDRIVRAFERRSLSLGENGMERVRTVLRDEDVLYQMDQRVISEFTESLADRGLQPLVVQVPAFSHDVHDMVSLGQVARFIESPGGRP